MSFVQKILDFFQSLINPGSEDAVQRQVVRKLESDLRSMAPSLYKSGLVQVNFAEALKVLFNNTDPIAEILGRTVCSPDLDCSRHYEEQLLMTGFDDEAKDILDSLAYDRRKEGALEATSMIRYFESEHRKLERVVKALNSAEFVKIDHVLDRLKQLNDICRFGYVSALRLFDTNYVTQPDYVPEFQPIPPDLMETSLLDLYYVAAEMDISNSLYNAVVALGNLVAGGKMSDEKAESLKDNFRKIQSIVKHIFTKEILMILIRIAKKNGDFIPDRAVYRGNARQKYADYLEDRFRVDEVRLKGEIQDATISNEINQIFRDNPMIPVVGYSHELNTQLMQSTPCSFVWIMPMQILKNFTRIFFEAHVKPLMNDIVIEGFFNNAAYKSEFSSSVFACNDALERISAFEKKFQRSAEFDEANITGLIHDSHKDASFENTLKDLIEKVNKSAKDVIQVETTNLFNLYKKINDVLLESKKPSSEIITNLKVLMMSSRNKENSDTMENQYGQWKIFLEIMKNYVIIGNIEKK